MHCLRPCLALLAALALQPAEAALPGAVGVLPGGNVFEFPASRSVGCGTVSIAGTPSPSITVSGGGCPPFEPLQGILLYSFQVSGPADLLIPVIVTSHFSHNANGAAQAGSSVTVAGNTFAGGNCIGGTSGQCGSFESMVTLMLTANTAYGVAMQATVSNFLGQGSATAFVDPVFTFDPSFLRASEFTFEFSPGIGNGLTVTPIPEPEVASLLALGLGVLAVVGRRRSRTERASS